MTTLFGGFTKKPYYKHKHKSKSNRKHKGGGVADAAASLSDIGLAISDTQVVLPKFPLTEGMHPNTMAGGHRRSIRHKRHRRTRNARAGRRSRKHKSCGKKYGMSLKSIFGPS